MWKQKLKSFDKGAPRRIYEVIFGVITNKVNLEIFIKKKWLNLRQRLLQASRNYSYYTIGLYHKCGQFKFLDFHHMDVLDFRLFFGPFGQLEGGEGKRS